MKTPPFISDSTLVEIAELLAAGLLRLRQREAEHCVISDGSGDKTANQKAVAFIENLRMHDRNLKRTDGDA